MNHSQPKPSTHIFINDVTLRDGEQAPGNTMTTEQKIVIARQLVKMGFNGIEAGFAVASPGDFDAVQAIASAIGPMENPNSSIYNPHPRISSLARLVPNDIELALTAIKPAPNRGVHVFISTSQQQLVKFDDAIRKRGGTPGNMNDFVWKLAIPSIEDSMTIIRERDPQAKIQFSPEDWTRTDEKVSDDIIVAAVKNGAHIINLPDTVGAGIPRIIFERVAHVRALLDRYGFSDVIISWHGHNDTGQGVACAMEALYGGAEQFETTILGIGERTGNYSYEGYLAALDANKATHEKIMQCTIYDSIVRTETMRTAELVAKTINFTIPREHPIVGANAFAHEAGIHQHGVIAGRATGENPYEVLKPEAYGAKSKLILGKHSGWAGIKDFLDSNELVYHKKDRQKFVEALSRAADNRRKGLSDDEFMELVYYPTVISLTNEGTKRTCRIEECDDSQCKTEAQREAKAIGKKVVKIVMFDGFPSGGDGYTKTFIGIASSVRSELIDAAMDAIAQEIPGVRLIDYENRIVHPEQGSHSEAVGTITLECNGHTAKGKGTAEGIDASNLLAFERAFDALWAQLQYAESIRKESGN